MQGSRGPTPSGAGLDVAPRLATRARKPNDSQRLSADPVSIRAAEVRGDLVYRLGATLGTEVRRHRPWPHQRQRLPRLESRLRSQGSRRHLRRNVAPQRVSVYRRCRTRRLCRTCPCRRAAIRWPPTPRPRPGAAQGCVKISPSKPRISSLDQFPRCHEFVSAHFWTTCVPQGLEYAVRLTYEISQTLKRPTGKPSRAALSSTVASNDACHDGFNVLEHTAVFPTTAPFTTTTT